MCIRDRNIVIEESSFFSHSLILIINGQSGDTIWKKNLPSRSRMILFNNKDLVYYSVLSILHYSIKQDSIKIIKPWIPLGFRYIANDKAGIFFGGVTRNISDKNEIPFMLFKNVNEKYVLFKKLDLSKYNFIIDSSNYLNPALSKIIISSQGEVIFFTPDKKLFFK